MSLTDKFDRNRRRQTGKIDPNRIDEMGDIQTFLTPGTMRTLTFVMLDGTEQFFNYADLTSGSYAPEENKIVLNYRGISSVTLVGRNLESLYSQLQSQLVKKVICLEKQYVLTKNEKEAYVAEIVITDLGV